MRIIEHCSLRAPIISKLGADSGSESGEVIELFLEFTVEKIESRIVVDLMLLAPIILVGWFYVRNDVPLVRLSSKNILLLSKVYFMT